MAAFVAFILFIAFIASEEHFLPKGNFEKISARSRE